MTVFENLLVTAIDDDHAIMRTVSQQWRHGDHLVGCMSHHICFKERGLVQKKLDSIGELIKKEIGNC